LQEALVEPAQIARTLASARCGGVAQVAWCSRPFSVRHAHDREGRPLLLCRAGGALDRALSPGEVAIVINFGASVWISGWATLLADEEARAAALDFALVNPLSDLLDVGRGSRIYRVDLAEVRLKSGGRLIDVDVLDYASCSPIEPVM
jgi:hypothetical protein